MSAAVSTRRLEVEVSGGRLAAFAFGSAEEAGATVVAVHGITANSHAWRPVARALAPHAAVVACDMRGRAESGGLPPPFGVGAYAADVLALIEALELDRPLVVGHSLGAYVCARLAAEHPERVRGVVLVDGGLEIPGTEGVDPQEFVRAFLGPALARLRMRFESRDAYRQWWREHPALAHGDVEDDDLAAYADHDLIGSEGDFRSSVSEEAVRADADELFEIAAAAHRLRVPATLLCAPRGLVDDPNPMQPLSTALAWVAEAPEQREALEVQGVNHYTIALAPAGAAAVAEAVLRRLR